jgi:hypothetical protein
MSCISCEKNQCRCKTKTITKFGPSGPKGVKGSPGKTSILVKNTVFVMKNGSNSTGLVERLDKPFLTIAGARNAALTAFTSRSDTARIRIIVESGTYQEDIILDKFIDYDLGNCVIDGCVTDAQVDFGTTFDHVWTNIIYGSAKIRNTGANTLVTGLLLWKPNTKLLIYCDSIGSVVDDGIAIINTKHTRIYANKIYSEASGFNYQIALEMSQGYSLIDYTPSLVEVIGADIYNTRASLAPTVAFTSGNTSKDQTLTLINCRVKQLHADTGFAGNKAAISCGYVAASNGKLNLYNTVLYSQYGNSIYVNSGNTLIVNYFHSNMANTVTAGAGTLTNVLGTTLTINAAVSAGF